MTIVFKVDDKLQSGNINRSQLVGDLKERKINNTKTSILFGRDKVDYTSDTQENLRSILQGIKRLGY